jgi:hypothetical protein
MTLRTALTTLLVSLMACPLAAQKPIKTVTPDEALKHKGKVVNVCGIVLEAIPTEQGGKVYFANNKGEAIWAMPIHDLASRMNELRGSRVCAYGRAYWNLTGLGIDTERIELVASREATLPEIAADVEKSKKRFPWEAVVAAAVVGAATIGAATSSGTTYYAPVELPPPVVTGSSVGSLWIDTVSGDGSVVVLSDGSVWAVDLMDQLRTSLWLPVQRVTISSGRVYGQFLLIRQGVRTETATVTRVR